MSLPLLLLFGFVSLALIVEFLFFIRRMQYGGGTLIKIGVLVSLVSVGTVLFLNRQTLIGSSKQLADTALPTPLSSAIPSPTPTQEPSPTPEFTSLQPETASLAATVTSSVSVSRIGSPTSTPAGQKQTPTQRPSPTKRFTPTPRTSTAPTVILPRTGGGSEPVIEPKLPIAGVFHPTLIVLVLALGIAATGFFL